MDDSYLLLFDGGRGGGKTMSAVVQCIIDMVCYRQTVFSMVPIVFDFKENENSPVVHYESKMLDIDALLLQDEMFRNSIVFWDEINLWLFSRSHASVLNKLSGLLVTLLRKLDMSLYATAQFLSLVDKNIRMQADANILCFDLHYQYRNLSKGQIIHQELKDISGKFTGRPFESTGVTYERLLHSNPFKGTYDTKKTFDIYEAQRRYRVKMAVKEITRDGVDNSFSDMCGNVKKLCDELPGERWYTSDIQEYLGSNGIQADSRTIGRMMKAAGYQHKQVAGGSYVYLRG